MMYMKTLVITSVDSSVELIYSVDSNVELLSHTTHQRAILIRQSINAELKCSYVKEKANYSQWSYFHKV